MIGSPLHPRAFAAVGRLALGASALLFFMMPAGAEYRLRPGDVLQISVAGVPELKDRTPIQPDGNISFPLLGTISVGGLSPSAASAKIQAGLAAKVFRQRDSAGHESVVVIEPNQVTATVAEFKSIFVDGDVSKPGEQSYRPAMTVREAVALSGGYDSLHLHMEGSPFLISADLRSGYEAQWTEYVKEQAGIWRIQNELGRQANFDNKRLADAPISHATIAHILGLESEQLAVHQEDYEQEKQFLHNTISQTDDHIKVVADEVQKDTQGEEADEGGPFRYRASPMRGGLFC